ncbi:unnamed protein product [Eruca vesicaria subsp. sativa]|uniref:Uncharacterized protein n=1 Tax=Eruca vesicaria subsp. sativa TaxID=29727 RepID=A0ABC8JEE7_ERUVS|nr:unnamed protein product [Eruca vesicaria subsp. sativa]
MKKLDYAPQHEDGHGSAEHRRLRKVAIKIVSPHEPSETATNICSQSWNHQAVVPYEQHNLNSDSCGSRQNRSEKTSFDQPERSLENTIVSPTRSANVMESNVTFRARGAPRALTFSPRSLQAAANGVERDQMIGALKDMDTPMELDDEKLDDDDQADDLLEEELLALQEEELKGKKIHENSGSSRALARREDAKPSQS